MKVGRPQRGVVIASAGAAGAILLAALLLTRPSSGAKPSCRSALIPAYLSPHAIVDLAASGPARPRLVVVNPSNGPGQESSAAYGRAVRAAQDAGARAVGYLPTNYARRPIADVVADIHRYASWYGVDGVFLDEASPAAADVRYYTALARAARAAGLRFVVLNPGVVPDRAYFSVADVIVTYEGSYGDYAAAMARTPAWLGEQPLDRVAHLVYGATRDEALAVVRTPARAGYVYATSGSLPDPWQSLPTYLHEEEEAIARCS